MIDLAERGTPQQLGRRRRTAVALTILATVVSFGHPALAEDEIGGNNVVQVNNERDGAWKTRAKSSVEQEPGPSIVNENVALARASCTDCRTVAVAVQAIIVEGPVDDFRPGNAAVAFNESCVRCMTYAYARQEVLYADGPVVLDGEAKDRYQAVKAQLDAVADSGLSFDEMTVELDHLAVELVAALRGAIEESGHHATERADRKVERDED